MIAITLAETAAGSANGAGAEITGLTVGGWVAMVGSVAFVTILITWCLYKVIATPGESEHIHSPTDIETPDVDKD